MITLSQDHIDEILRLTKEAHPYECCGLLVGTNYVVDQLMPSDNVSDGDKTRTFELDARVRFQQIREYGEDKLIGFYHSHPNGIPFPSDTDRSMVYEPHLLWLIATQNEIRAFKFSETNQDFEEIPIQVKL